ncbi:MAG: hypothetical protein CMN30_03650 [Sandaracinus sp.]|nr:hypothetical protein [Sandaracinus sp.]|tara:strand:- start:695 stop:1366 length:672 start_codon:yes stop_codon:yes gene_type:complete
MKLYELEWGLYPRRIEIYLAEKGLDGIERVTYDALAEWPPPEVKELSVQGTLPVLRTPSGETIGDSGAILDYLEDRFPEPNLRGMTPLARARCREALTVVDEAALHFVRWCQHASRLFAAAGVDQQPLLGVSSARGYFGKLATLERFARRAGGEFLAGPQLTVADCAAMGTLQFADRFYGVPIPDSCPTLVTWYERFSQRPSATPPSYPPPLHELAMGLRIPA